MDNQDALVEQLDSFDPGERREALEKLASLDVAQPEQTENVNMHFHSFFSFNANDWSPSHIAWRAYQEGLYAAGLCDFDVLDGLEEFLHAGLALPLRTTVNIETRAFLREYSEAEITSPGEPGVTYIMGAAFPYVPEEGSAEAEQLAGYRQRAQDRNIALVNRINPNIEQIAIDYEEDVLPLAPLNAPTERHIVRAYVNKAEQVFESEDAVADYWAGILDTSADEVRGMMGTPDLEGEVRSRLVKRGGIGYVQPSEDTFPPVDEFVDWVLACDAVPMITWLDGTSEGEKEPRPLLECMIEKGCAALNIIPDRNWNLDDADERELKISKLREIVELADELGLPINVGTEMNKPGLPLVDDLSGPVLSEFKESFLRGARVMVGHSILCRYAGVSYIKYDAAIHAKNDFFEAVGALPPLSEAVAAELADMREGEAFAAIEVAVGDGQWPET